VPWQWGAKVPVLVDVRFMVNRVIVTVFSVITSVLLSVSLHQ